MQAGEPSQTAKMTAVMRAHHFLTAPEPKILHDNVALALSGAANETELMHHYQGVVELFTALSDKETAELFVLRSAHAVCMRSRLFEEELLAALQEGAEQVIILGAGLDTTAYRYAALLKDCPIYEIDHPETQKWKKKTLENAGITIPENLHFIGVDFETQTLPDALAQAGIDRSRITVMSWLGVVMYLTDESTIAGFKELGSFAPGSRLVMDFLMPDYAQSKEFEPDSLVHLNKVVSEMGEPMINQYTVEMLDERLEQAGFQSRHFYSSQELAALFMNGQRELFSMPDDTITLLSATV